MTPEQNFNFINNYLSRVSPVIRAHNGFIDKYIGDAVMALFPESVDDAISGCYRYAKTSRKSIMIQRQSQMARFLSLLVLACILAV